MAWKGYRSSQKGNVGSGFHPTGPNLFLRGFLGQRARELLIIARQQTRLILNDFCYFTKNIFHKTTRSDENKHETRPKQNQVTNLSHYHIPHFRLHELSTFEHGASSFLKRICIFNFHICTVVISR